MEVLPLDLLVLQMVVLVLFMDQTIMWAINDGGYAERWKANDPGKAAYFVGEETQASYGKVNPHNYFLQVAFEIGIPGLLLVLAFWGAVFWLGLKGVLRGTV